MNGKVRAALPVLWTALVVAVGAYAVAVALEQRYGVPLREGSFRFERPWAGLLLLGAVLALISRGWMHRATSPRLRISRGREVVRAGAGWRLWFKDGLVGMRVGAVAFMALALMGPQSIHARSSTEVEGIDIVLALDMSLSMQAADIQPDRFDAAKEVVSSFVRRRPNDRIGAVVFGREAYTLLPLTTDKTALRSIVADLELGSIDGRGTAIGNAVGTALNRLRDSEAESRVVILLTDGDSNAGNISPDQAADLASTMGAKVYTVLMGQSDEARVKRGRDLFGRAVFDRGSFPVNPELLEAMAESTGGEAYRATDRRELEDSFHRILDTLEKSEIEDAGKVYGELYPAFLWPAFGLLGLELLLGTLVLRRWP
ncbi:MAG: VWA domain-containing protein [Myxococcota bacterium]